VKPVRVRIDASRCGRVGFCASSAPGIFAASEDGPSRALVDEVTDPDQIEQVREAEALCPTEAIVVEEADASA
jgi:ferredoxin